MRTYLVCVILILTGVSNLINVNILFELNELVPNNYPNEDFQITSDNNEIETGLINNINKFQNKDHNYRNFVDLNGNNNSSYWLDSFLTPDMIAWGYSENLNISEARARINMPYFADLNTMAFWHFNENSGTNIYDDTEYNNDGALIGDTYWVAGKYGDGLRFDGNSDGVVVPDSPSLSIKNSITVSAWVRFSTIPTAGTSYPLVTKREAGSDTYQLVIDSGGYARFLIDTGTAGIITGNTALNDGNWHFIAGTWDRTLICIYVDGELDAAPVTRTGRMVDTVDVLRIGHQRVWQGGVPFWWYYNGDLDDVRISNIARSKQEIKNIYENGTPKKYHYANVTSEPINIPENMHWDTIIINKTQPTNTYLNITILNASTGIQIPGTPKYLGGGEFDISFIDSNKYTSIQLFGSFSSYWYQTPLLYYWGVCYNSSNIWTDTFFGGDKVESIDHSKVGLDDGIIRFNQPCNLISKYIHILDKHHYHTLFINKSESSKGYLNITILDSNNNIIDGFKDLTGTRIDILSINPLTYPKIKLQAIFEGGVDSFGYLFDWSITWKKNTAPIINNITSPKYVCRLEPLDILLNISDCEELSENLQFDIEYKSLADVNWKTEFITILGFDPELKLWHCQFHPDKNIRIGFYSFKFTIFDIYDLETVITIENFVEILNNEPQIHQVIAKDFNFEVKRLDTLNLKVNATDLETARFNLVLKVRYKTNHDQLWQNEYIKNIQYISDYWHLEFAPSKAAEVGTYILNVTCNDTQTEVYKEIEVEVLNNRPNPPEVKIMPLEPKTTDNLEIKVLSATDLETSSDELVFWYRWYKDDILFPEFENITIISNNYTEKDQIWRCEVYSYDGIDCGLFDYDEVLIVNSPPILVEEFVEFKLYEDSPLFLKGKLFEIFNDPDNDKLEFGGLCTRNISVEIYNHNGSLKIKPAQNWFGADNILLSVNDSYDVGQEINVTVKVVPTNDLPEIVQIGDQYSLPGHPEMEFIVKQDEWLNLSIKIRDIDGDIERGIFALSFNFTEQDNLFFQKDVNILSYKPKNLDVGWHYYNIKLTDNNETPPIYIFQKIRLRVINVNDPPIVIINKQLHYDVFLETEDILLVCTVIDEDLLIKDSNEEISILWLMEYKGTFVIGKGLETKIFNGTVEPGVYNVSVIATDSAKETDIDYLTLTIKKVKKDVKDPGTPIYNLFTNNSFWLIILFIILLVILLLIIPNYLTYRKKQDLETKVITGELVLQPDGAYLPKLTTQTGTLAQNQLQSPAIIDKKTILPQYTESSPGQPQAATTFASVQTRILEPKPMPIPQLPPAQIDENKVSSHDNGITLEHKLELLETRFLTGEISEDTFVKLKDKIEKELNESTKTTPRPGQLPVNSNEYTDSSTEDTLEGVE